MECIVLKGEKGSRVIVLILMIVIISVTLSGCNSNNAQSRMPKTPEGFDEELWEEGYKSYIMLRNAIMDDRLLTQEEDDFIVDFLENKSVNALTIEELELYTMMLEVAINQAIVAIFELQQQDQGDVVVKDEDIIQAKRKTRLALKHLDEMYDKYR